MYVKLLKKSMGICALALLLSTATNAREFVNPAGESGESQLTAESSQARVVTGKVISVDNNESLPGVNIIIKGTTTGAISDLDGNYSVSVTDDAAVLIFSSVGYETIEMAVGAQSIINISLVADITSLSEIIVVGYGTQEKRDVTAAIASVSAESITKIPTANMIEALKGQVSGVDVVQAGGRPGQYPSVTIRGRRSVSASNEPLYVIDGVPMIAGSGTIYDFNPQDLESMEILKDAAATAIYGSRGANGVILVTTKRGKSGKAVVSYDGYYGVTSPIRDIDWMMDGETFADLKRESRREDSAGKLGRQAWNGTIPDDSRVFSDPREVTSLATGRYQDYLMGSTDPTGYGLDVPFNGVIQDGSQTNHQIGIMGGTEKVQYNMSLGYFNEQGIIVNQNYERITGRINVDAQISKNIKVGMSSFMSIAQQNWGSNETLGEAFGNNPLGAPYILNAENDSVIGLDIFPIVDGIRTNPYNELVPNAYIDQRDFTRIFSSFYVDATIVKGLKYKFLFGPDLRFRTNGSFQGSKTNARRNGDSAASTEKNQETGYTIENLLTYDKKIGAKHDLQFTFLQSIQSQRYDFMRTGVINLPYETQLWYNLGSAGTISGVSSGLSERQLASFMGRINYAFADKYLLQLTYRADGSSVLADGNKWASFPGASIGWRVIDENFMSGVKSWLDELKVRASYGAVGNQSVNPYQTAGRLTRSFYDWDGANAAGFRLNEIPNPNLGWEISKTINVGIDFGFWNGRISGTIDAYNTNTEDLLLQRNLPITSGYGFILENVGATETSGIELGLSATLFDTQGGFRWILDGNITHYTEAIRELALKGPNGEPIDDVGSNRFIGQPLRVFFDYQKIGIWQADEAEEAFRVDGSYPGDIKVADLHGPRDANGVLTGPDGKISGEDRIVLGSDVPTVFGGINNRFEYKGFDLSIFFVYRVGHMIQSDLHSGLNTMQGRYNNMDVDYWTIDNPTNAFPRPNFNQEFPQKNSTLRYFDGSYWKLRNVVLGYNLPKTISEKLHMTNLRVYATAQNPWYSAKFETYDPENSGSIGTDDVPSSKLFLLGINFQF